MNTKRRAKRDKVVAHNAEFDLREQDKDRATFLANLRQPTPHKNGKR